jgi:hypothetical protein
MPGQRDRCGPGRVVRQPVARPVDQPLLAGQLIADAQARVVQRAAQRLLEGLRLGGDPLDERVQPLERRPDGVPPRIEPAVHPPLHPGPHRGERKRADRRRDRRDRHRVPAGEHPAGDLDRGEQRQQDGAHGRPGHRAADRPVDVVEVMPQHGDRGRGGDGQHQHAQANDDEDLGLPPQQVGQPAEQQGAGHRQRAEQQPRQLGPAHRVGRPAVAHDHRRRAGQQQAGERGEQHPGRGRPERAGQRPEGVGDPLEGSRVGLGVHRGQGEERGRHHDQAGGHPPPARTGQPTVREGQHQHRGRDVQQHPRALHQPRVQRRARQRARMPDEHRGVGVAEADHQQRHRAEQAQLRADPVARP